MEARRDVGPRWPQGVPHRRQGAHRDSCTLRQGRFGKADDPRGQHDEHLLVIHLFVFLGKEVTQPRNVAQPRNPLHLIGQGSLNQTTQEIYFSFLQAEVVLNNPLAESGLT